MKTTKTATLLIALSTLIATTVRTRAQSHPFQAALWAPDLQLVPANEDVRGVRLQIYGINRHVSGLDVGLVNITTGDFAGAAGVVFFLPALYNRVDGATAGFQAGFVNVTDGRVRAGQVGLVNVNRDDASGFQAGLVNWNEPAFSDVRGLQAGLFNTGGAVEGLQLGLVNRAMTLRGVQLGLWNEVASRAYDEFDPLPRVFPFINIGL